MANETLALAKKRNTKEDLLIQYNSYNIAVELSHI